MAVDLHVHTAHSDGSYSPSELIELVAQYDVDTLSVTDHDVISGIEEAAERGQHIGIRVIPGTELSIDYPLSGSAHLHLLGLYIDIHNPVLIKALQNLRLARRERAKEIIERLKRLNIDIRFDDLELRKHGASLGRPHIAKLLVEMKIVKSIKEAFQKYIGRSGPAFVPKKKLNLKQAIELIHRAKGLALIAHPVSLGAADKSELFKYLDEFRAAGLDGIEAYYSYHSEEFTKTLIEYARKNGMAISGGTDFHGDAKPDIKPAVGAGNLIIPTEVVEQLDAYYRKLY